PRRSSLEMGGAMLLLAPPYRWGQGVDKDKGQALAWLPESAAGDNSAVIESLRQRGEGPPTQAEAPNTFQHGLEALENGDHDRAIACFSAVLKGQPSNPRAHLHRGLAYYGEKNYEKALADFTEAIRLAPQTADAYVGRGKCLVAKREWDRAIGDYTQAL